MFKSKVLAVILLASAAAMPASAASIAFNSDGGFSNISGYNGSPPANITTNSNVLDMGGFNNSTLTANDFTFSGSTPLNDTVIGKITWINRASSNTDQNFNVSYSLLLTFTAPNADTASQSFNLNITQPTNPPGDTVAGLTIAGLPSTFQLNGVTVGDFKFSVQTGAGLGGTFANGTWSNPDPSGIGNDDSRTSVLLLTADFSAVTAVPEPAGIGLAGVGMLGLGLARRRTASRTAA